MCNASPTNCLQRARRKCVLRTGVGGGARLRAAPTVLEAAPACAYGTEGASGVSGRNANGAPRGIPSCASVTEVSRHFLSLDILCSRLNVAFLCVSKSGYFVPDSV